MDSFRRDERERRDLRDGETKRDYRDRRVKTLPEVYLSLLKNSQEE